MLKRHIRTLIFLTAVLLAVTPAGATTTRDSGLGLSTLPWMIDGLQGHAYDNPSYLSDFKNIVFFEHAGVDAGDNYGGVILSPANNLFVAAIGGLPVSGSLWNGSDYEGFFHTGSYDVKGGSIPDTLTGNYQVELLNPSLTSDENTLALIDPDGNGSTAATASAIRKPLEYRYVNVLGAYDFGRWAIGVNFGYSGSWTDKSYDSSTASSDDAYLFSNSEYDIGVGGLFRINSAMSVDADVKVSLYMLENTYDRKEPGITMSMSYETDKAMDIAAAVRYNLALTKTNKMHARVAYAMINHSTKGAMSFNDESDPLTQQDTSETFKRTGHQISLGVSDEMRFSDRVVGFAGLNAVLKLFTSDYSGFDYVDATRDADAFKSERTILQVPIVVGAEAKLSENWTGRFGVLFTLIDTAQDKISNVTDSDATQNKYSDTTKDNNSSSTSINVGLSYKISNFRLDWLANIDLFVKGPDFVSGDSSRVTNLNSGYQGTPLSLAFAATYSFDGLIKGEQGENLDLAPETGKPADKAGKPKI